MNTTSDICAICHESYTNKNISVTDCNHKFHTNCLCKWLKEHDTCPICIKPIIENDNRPKPAQIFEPQHRRIIRSEAERQRLNERAQKLREKLYKQDKLTSSSIIDELIAERELQRQLLLQINSENKDCEEKENVKDELEIEVEKRHQENIKSLFETKQQHYNNNRNNNNCK